MQCVILVFELKKKCKLHNDERLETHISHIYYNGVKQCILITVVVGWHTMAWWCTRRNESQNKALLKWTGQTEQYTKVAN